MKKFNLRIESGHYLKLSAGYLGQVETQEFSTEIEIFYISGEGFTGKNVT